LTHHKKVIQLPPPNTWAYWDWVSLNGANPIEDWRKGLSEEAEKLFNNILKFNRKAPTQLQWIGRGRHFFLEGKGKEARIWELVFQDSDKVQYRILGVFWPKHAQKQVTFLLGCTHKDGVYDPPDWLETAIDRKKKLENGGAKRHVRQVRESS